MRIAEMLNAIANWLESPNNEAMLLADYDDDCLKVVAESCVEAASALKKAAETVDQIEPAEESKLTPEALDDLATLASAFDMSGDDELKKQASVIDELLLTIAAPPNFKNNKQAAEDKKIEEIKKNYEDVKNKLEDYNKIADARKGIEGSEFVKKKYNILEAPLKTRYCPDHAGVQMSRVEENVYQCELDKKTYNFEIGYDLMNGTHVPGSSVANQSEFFQNNMTTTFDTREDKLNR